MSRDYIELPDGWRIVSTGDVAEVVGGGTPKTSVSGNFTDEGGHPWLTPADLTGYSEMYISRGRRNLTDQGLKTSSAKYMPAGSVLFSSRAPIGYIAIASNPLTTNQGFRSFVPTDEVESEYLYYALKLLRPEAEQLASGTTFPEISGTNAKKLRFPLAPRETQRRVVNLLDRTAGSTTSASCHLAAARLAIERFRQAVLSAACSGRLTADWREKNPQLPVEQCPQLSTQAMRNASGAPNTSELVDLPETWAWWTIESITAQVIDYRGRTPPSASEGEIPHVRTTQIRRGRIDWHVDRFVTQEIYDEYMTRGLPRRDDVLFTMEAPLGEVGVVDRDLPFSLAQRILLMRPAAGLDGEFLCYSLQSHPVQRAIEFRATGSGVLGIAYKRLRSVQLPNPPLDEQHEIVRRVARMLEMAEAVEKKITACELRVPRCSEAVLAKAFRGELTATVG